MNREELLETLQSLHNELDADQEIDDETRRMLQTVTDDIHGVLDKKVAQPDENAADEEDTVSKRLRETLIEFEARHPQIGGLLERLTNGLSNMGI